MKYILTIDQSTFSTKVFIIDEESNMLASSSYQHQQYYPQNGWVEHDGEEIYTNLLKAVSTLKKEFPELVAKVAGIAITNQRETTILWDKRTGKPVHHAIVWQCRRTASMCEKLKIHQDLVEKLTGLKINPYFSAPKIKWLIENCKLDEIDNYAFGTMESWLIYNLTNGKKHVSDVTNASRTLLMNIETLKWDEMLCSIFDIPSIILPAILNNDEIFGYSDVNGILDHEVPICGVIGDSQAALYAQHCFETGSMKVTLGTGSSVMINAGSCKPQLTKGIVNAVGWCVENRIIYAQEAIINCSCDTLNWLKNLIGLFKKEAQLNSIWDEIENNDGVYLVPAFVGLSVPWWNDQARASICGLARNHDYKYILRAGLESIAYQIYDAATALGYTSNQIMNIDGGAVSNIGLLQFIADILNVEVKVSYNYALSAMGAYEISRLKLFGQTEYYEDKKKYFPTMDEKVRNANIYGWHQAVKGVLAVAKLDNEVEINDKY
ncbi:FGGY-family carbohydrate kinase [Thomasclavelia ramosa]|uniref:FGGY-family carbohydrate kinase n=2 Tax=Thomasclavelia ramosa TaxID=1547 RepID=UPI00344DE096